MFKNCILTRAARGAGEGGTPLRECLELGTILAGKVGTILARGVRLADTWLQCLGVPRLDCLLDCIAHDRSLLRISRINASISAPIRHPLTAMTDGGESGTLWTTIGAG